MGGELTDTGNPKRKRRWLQYSLRTFPLLVAVFAVWLAIQVNEAHKQRAAVAAIEAAGGVVTYDCRPAHQKGRLDIYDTDSEGNDRRYPRLSDVFGDEYFETVVSVWFFTFEREPTHPVDDKERVALAHLRDLPGLEHLILGDIPITDDDLKYVVPLTRLTNFVTASPHITDAGLQQLTRLGNLEQLLLDYAALTDKSIPVLLSFPKLNSLGVGLGISDEGEAQLRRGLPANSQIMRRTEL